MTYSSTDPKYCTRRKRIVKSDNQNSYWQVRQKTGAIEAILQPWCAHNSKESASSICNVKPAQVTKTTSKIKYGNQTSSRYHKKCLKPKPKPLKPNIVKRNVTNLIDPSIDSVCGPKKQSKFKNECYCIKPPTKPKLSCEPECTVPNRYADSLNNRSQHLPFTYRPETLKLAKDVIDYVPQSAFLSRIYRSNCDKCVCNTCMLKTANTDLKFTERRLLLEKAYHNLAEASRINYDKLNELNCVNVEPINISPVSSQNLSRESRCTQSPSSKKFSPYGSNRSSPRSSESPLPSHRVTLASSPNSAKSEEMNCAEKSRRSKYRPTIRCKSNQCDDKICLVKNIRQQHYFDTHSTQTLSKSKGAMPPEGHKCIFKYTIDDRGLLKPLNPDAYGICRCCICNKAQPEESPECKNTCKKGSHKTAQTEAQPEEPPESRNISKKIYNKHAVTSQPGEPPQSRNIYKKIYNKHAVTPERGEPAQSRNIYKKIYNKHAVSPEPGEPPQSRNIYKKIYNKPALTPEPGEPPQSRNIYKKIYNKTSVTPEPREPPQSRSINKKIYNKPALTPEPEEASKIKIFPKKRNNKSQNTQTSMGKKVAVPAKLETKITQTSKHINIKPQRMTRAYHMQFSNTYNEILPNREIQKCRARCATSKAPITAIARIREYPSRICNPTPDKTVQLNIMDPFTFAKTSISIPKNIIPANTWALRYQKRCAYSS